MKKVIAVITTLFFLLVPTFLLAEGMEGGQPTGQDNSVKAQKTVKKTSRSKKMVRRAAKKNKHAKMKAMKLAKQNKPMKDINSMPAHQ